MKLASGGFEWSRDATAVLCQLYEGHPCLYLPTMPDYHNRVIRQKALQDITTEFNRRYFTSLKVEDIKKKIHGIRAQFLAELKKIKKSEVSGTSADSVYQPKLWCFDLLHFLQQGSMLVSQGESNLTIQDSTESGTTETDEIQEEAEILYEGDISNVDVNVEVVSPSPTPSTSRTPSRGEGSVDVVKAGSKKRKRQGEKESFSDLLSSAVSTLNSMAAPMEHVEEPQERKRHALFGQFIAEEMECLTDEEILDEAKQAILQAIFAAKGKQRVLNKQQ